MSAIRKRCLLGIRTGGWDGAVQIQHYDYGIHTYYQSADLDNIVLLFRGAPLPSEITDRLNSQAQVVSAARQALIDKEDEEERQEYRSKRESELDDFAKIFE